MPAPLHIQLTPEEERTLSELRIAATVPYRTRDRAHVLRLNANGWTVYEIAKCFNWHEQTVRQTIHRWEKFGLGGLWEASGRGAKPKWQEADIQYLEQCLEQEQRTYNSEQLAKKLASDRQVQLSPDRIRRVFKKRGSAGSAPDIVIAASFPEREKQLKQADLATLELAQVEGYIDLKYLDESGFCLWSPVSYSLMRRGEQKRLEQSRRRGQRLSILGLWEPDSSFEYALKLGSFKGDSYIRVMDWVASKAAKQLQDTGRLTVVVQDNGSLHTCQQVQDKWSEWQEKGLFIFFLPKYCSEMNPIEGQWHQLKTHELAGRMFEDEYDLAVAVMNGMEDRSRSGEYSLERFKFNCA